VKELVENALDAEATRIDVGIAAGGTRWISVTDDGFGMSSRDAELAFRRHATSKIRSVSDLERVTTLGFRGEALPSIASVADVRMRTRRAADSVGVEVLVAGSELPRVSPTACPEGTRIEVGELFARVPARRKFLKSEATEWGHIARLLEELSLVRPDVRFALERDGRSALLLPAVRDVRERVVAVLPPSTAERLLAFDGSAQGADVSGFASPTDVFRGSPADLHLFVNGRAVRDRLLLFAVRDAYRDALPPGRYPVVVLYLRIDAELVDANVHPTKAEVRFREPEQVKRLVRGALARALGVQRGRAPAHAAGPAAQLPFAPSAPPRTWQLGGEQDEWRARPEWVSDAVADAAAPASVPDPGRVAPLVSAVTLPPRSDLRPELPFAAHRYLGQSLGTYLLLERPGALVLLDQHAAHERVLFERLRAGLLADKLERQALLVPLWLELPRSAADALGAERTALERAGFEIEVAETSARGGVRVGVRSIPAGLAPQAGGRPSPDWGALLAETAAGLADPSAREARDGVEGLVHHVLATAACHAAVRKGDRMDEREVRALLEQLDAVLWFPNCPHGRPIQMVLAQSELERRFLRRT
jgi:DNA mismatch repair protein MutL